MSEYQYYEFRAVDRGLDKAEMAALRRISSRAEITARGFVNTYNYGDLRAEPLDLVERYFDVFVYVANWGTHWFMVRLPRADVDLEALRRYEIEPVVEIHERGECVIIEVTAQSEAGDWESGEEWMPELVGLRDEIGDGDLRALYLGWLSAADYGEMEDDEPEPPVPSGMGALSASLAAFAGFVRVGEDLIATAAERSDPVVGTERSTAQFERWVRALPVAEKDALLLRAMGGEEPRLGAGLRRRFQRENRPAPAASSDTGRTVGELLAAAQERIEARDRVEAAKQAKAEARRLAAEAAARVVYLDGLARRGDGVWGDIEGMVDSKKPTEYDRAVRLVGDLRDIADRDGDIERFGRRLRELRGRHAKKVSLIGRLDEAGLEG